ncbi:hypothetical protein E8E11_010859 [Didymella keratinophila]|nr:hypothetical protein E8E11_010859 [Didymella keratinophila]
MLTHYQTLDVSHSADVVAIKKAYHSISLLCHPDKTVHLLDAERTQREQLFKLANIAFEILSDPQKRKAYDQNIRLGQGRPTTQARNTTTHHPHDPASGRQPPPRSRAAQPDEAQSFQDSSSIQRAPSSVHRFTASTLGKAPDFQWYHFNVASRFKVVARPVIPQKLVSDSIVVRLPLLRKGKDVPRAPNNVFIDLRGVPGNKHTILCSLLVESQAAGLELVVEIAVATSTAQAGAQGSAGWKWTYNIDHEPLTASTQARVTNMLLFPYMPFMAIAPNGGMPASPYPEESPMRGLLTQFPGIKIEESAPEAYCVKEKQLDKTMWRLTAVGSM